MIGQRLQAPGLPDVIVVGQMNGSLVVSAAAGFSSPYVLDGEEAAAYSAPEPEEPDEVEAWRRLARP